MREVGPFARLRPGAELGEEVHIGNFVEVKNSTLAKGAKANHLAYLGDATVGERVNYGAGSITANYDGANKHRTVIGADVHIGSNCVLVAPVTIGAGATIGGGSTVSKDAPAGQLTVARAKAGDAGRLEAAGKDEEVASLRLKRLGVQASQDALLCSGRLRPVAGARRRLYLRRHVVCRSPAVACHRGVLGAAGAGGSGVRSQAPFAVALAGAGRRRC